MCLSGLCAFLCPTWRLAGRAEQVLWHQHVLAPGLCLCLCPGWRLGGRVRQPCGTSRCSTWFSCGVLTCLTGLSNFCMGNLFEICMSRTSGLCFDLQYDDTAKKQVAPALLQHLRLRPQLLFFACYIASDSTPLRTRACSLSHTRRAQHASRSAQVPACQVIP